MGMGSITELDPQQWTPSPGPAGFPALDLPDEPACLCAPPAADAEQLGSSSWGHHGVVMNQCIV